MTLTDNLSPVVLPGFQKRSGTKIIEALRNGGWTIDGFSVQYGDRHTVKAHHPFNNDNVVNRVNVTVSENGALGWAEFKVNDLRGHGTGSVSEACHFLSAPSRVIAQEAEKARRDAHEEARTLSAQVAKAHYRNGEVWEKYKWLRERLTALAACPKDTIIRGDRYATTVLDGAEKHIKAQFLYYLAHHTLSMEGTPREWDETGTKVLSVYDLKEAAREVLFQSTGNSEARSRATGHLYSEAQSELYWIVR